MSKTSVTKVKRTADGELIFTYSFNYSVTPVAITVTISQPGQVINGASPPNGSPPDGPPNDGVTPQTYPFEQGVVRFKLEMTNADPIRGYMEVRMLGPGYQGDNALIWCNVFYGFHGRRNFQGTSVTFQTSMT